MTKDLTQLLCDVNEMTGLFQDTDSLESFLQRIVELTARHLGAEVCSIYLYFEETQDLVLRATQGLKKEAIGRVRLKLGEGLTGKALKELRPICVQGASRVSGYRYFPEIGEEAYESFLAVPIVRGHTRIGVFVIQNDEKNYFQEDDIRVLKALASQLGNTIETTKAFLRLREPNPADYQPAAVACPSEIEARVGAPGWAVGEADIWDSQEEIEGGGESVLSESLTLEHLRKAVEETERELEALQARIEDRLSDVASMIFTAQILMLKDKSFWDRMEVLVEAGHPVLSAVKETVEFYVRQFEAMPNPYLREKKHDIRDMGRRLCRRLQGNRDSTGDWREKIVIASYLLPSDILKLALSGAKGVVLLSGGITSHLAILARSLEIPLFIAQEPSLRRLPRGTVLSLESEPGVIRVNPTVEQIQALEQRRLDQGAGSLASRVPEPARTRDGTEIVLMANVNLLSDAQAARAAGAQGIGLYRTEFPFLVRPDFPSEEEQYLIYRRLIEQAPPGPMTFRTLDIGGDKVLSYFDFEQEENPFLGMRSIRFSLRYPDVFQQQVRAILRAGRGADLRIMFPMISSVDEWEEARRLVDECRGELKRRGEPFHDSPAVGVMIELPAVLEFVEELAAAADFFCVGTNDFIQYLLAVDRTNEKVADMYVAYHPAVLRALSKVAAAARQANKPVTVCGDMAHDERALEFLIGVGFRQLSLDPRMIPRIREAIASVSLAKAKEKAASILAASTVAQARRLFEISS